MSALVKQLRRWTDAQLIDSATAERILQFENRAGGRSLRWPAILAIAFGALMLSSGVLLFVSSHWDHISPAGRFSMVLAMVAVFHLVAGLTNSKMPAMGVALHAAGTIVLGAGIYLAAQIFNLQEHWPGGIMLWALGALIGWIVLRQWPQALLAALLIPWWLTGEWMVATTRYQHAFTIAAQGLLLLAILFFSTPQSEDNRPLSLGLQWTGCLALIPLTLIIVFSGESYRWQQNSRLPLSLTIFGYLAAYLPTLLFGWFTRAKEAAWLVIFALWTAILALTASEGNPEKDAFTYLWLGLGAVLLCYWGVRTHRKLFINFGSATFAITIIAFYFSSVFDKLGRAAGLAGMGVLFLLGGWTLNRLRTGLIARVAAGDSL